KDLRHHGIGKDLRHLRWRRRRNEGTGVNVPVAKETADLVELRIPSRAEWVALARLAVSAVANRLRFSIEEIEDIKLAVAEACTAVIQHATHGEFIEPTCETSGSTLRIRVADAGRHSPQFETGRSIDLDEARIAGLGIFLIRTLMDEVTY